MNTGQFPVVFRCFTCKSDQEGMGEHPFSEHYIYCVCNRCGNWRHARQDAVKKLDSVQETLL